MVDSIEWPYGELDAFYNRLISGVNSDHIDTLTTVLQEF